MGEIWLSSYHIGSWKEKTWDLIHTHHLNGSRHGIDSILEALQSIGIQTQDKPDCQPLIEIPRPNYNETSRGNWSETRPGRSYQPESHSYNDLPVPEPPRQLPRFNRNMILADLPNQDLIHQDHLDLPWIPGMNNSNKSTMSDPILVCDIAFHP